MLSIVVLPAMQKECDASCCFAWNKFIYIYILDVTPFVYIFGLDSNDLYPPTTLIHSAQLGDKQFGFTLIDCHKS